ncbi:10487_t:CDS:2 [Funneliformis geosporum]|uniref:17808_t:CDS:1 n=1 Tax=Funneliformis geosporum TaxID=1117311 RepID=A0A9W4SJU9_9GLOM|nr:10487_t:CDS:2 [Funneliformis geosporum]CAI2171722.1 17808_t:CDS:2 [Funneliformis geosporum]
MSVSTFALKLSRFLWRRASHYTLCICKLRLPLLNFRWTRGYSSNKEISYVNSHNFSFIDLTELANNPKAQNNVINQIDQLLEKKEKEQRDLLRDLLEKKEKEQKELLRDLLEKKEKEQRDLLEKKNNEHEDLLEKKNNEPEDRAHSILQMKHMCNVRDALEFIRAQILAKDMSIVFTETLDKALNRLSQDEKFTKYLQKACEDNRLQYEDVQKCVGGLYHSTSKHFHGHEQKVIIDSRTWATNEIFLLGVIFRHYKVPFEYCNTDGKLEHYPYKL